MDIDPNIFRLYDIRGTYPDQLNEEVVYRVARAFIHFLRDKNGKTIQRVVIGRDARLSSEEFKRAFAKGIMDEGSTAIDMGLSITPSVYFFVAHNGYEGGVNITASHQPNPFNGLKLVGEGAVPIGAQSGLADIQKLTESTVISSKNSGGAMESIPNALEKYIDFQVESFYGGMRSKASIKVAADAGNGTAGPYAEAFFQKIGVSFTPLCFEPDGRFPNHAPDPLIMENTKDLRDLMQKDSFSFGIAFDGDGDRLLFFTEEGIRLRGDEITALLARRILKEEPGAHILYDIRASRMVSEVIMRYGGKPILSPIGHTLVKQIMKRENVRFGGELSGHYYLGAPYFYEMPFFVLSRVMEELVISKIKMSELIDSLESKWFHSGEINFEIEEKEGKVEELAAAFQGGTTSRLDGVRIDYPDWWFLVRPSANDPVLRLVVEADSQEKMEEKVKELSDIIMS